MVQALLSEPVCQVTGDVGRAVVAQPPWPMDFDDISMPRMSKDSTCRPIVGWGNLRVDLQVDAVRAEGLTERSRC